MTESAPPSASNADAFLERAVELAAHGPAFGPNPRVGSVIVSSTGQVLGEGFHRGAGTPHAEVAALAAAAASGADVKGATAFVTLEPCNHTGRTGPCSHALFEAGISKVVYAVPDPNPSATGGAQWLRDRGVEATLVPFEPARSLNARWLGAVSRGRPWVIAKWGQSIDGFIAAADGSSFWITGEQSREHAHQTRAVVDAIVVGTGTVLADDPSLTARPGGVLAKHQPLRVVVGSTSTAGKKVWSDPNSLSIASHEPAEVLAALWEREVRTVIVEGGGTLISAFIRAGLVDELNVYIAPALLGEGTSAAKALGIGTMSQALRGGRPTWATLGDDTLLSALLTEGS